jgi:hypothetical protein
MVDVIMNEGNVRKWCRFFNGDVTDVHNEERSRRQCIFTNSVVAHVRQNTLLTIDELREVFFYASQPLLYEIAIVQLQHRSICARWVPRMLTSRSSKKGISYGSVK